MKIGDTVEVTVEVAELIPERLRARLACTCKVGDEVVLDGEAWVKVPSASASGRPLPRFLTSVPVGFRVAGSGGPAQPRAIA